MILPYIIEADAVTDSILPDKVAYVIRRLSLEVTLPDVKHLVEILPDVKAKTAKLI